MGKHFVSLTLLFLFFVPAIANATLTAYEHRLEDGLSRIEEKNYIDAVKEFRAALKEKPDDAMATLFLGIALSRMGDKEAEAVLKRALFLDPQSPRANLELGIYNYNTSKYTEAKRYLDKAITLSDDKELSEKAEEYLNLIEGKPWAVNISLGGQYDTNVILNPDGGGLPRGISKKSDFRGVLNIVGKYDFIKKENGEASISYNLYQSLHFKLNEFDTSDHILELKGIYAISPFLNLKGVYAFEYTFVGWESYYYSNSIAPSLIISEGNGFSTILEYKYANKRFLEMGNELFANNSERTGSNHAIKVTQNIPIHESILGRIGYSYDMDLTRKEYWNYSGHKGFAGLRFNMPFNIFLDLYGEYYRKQYDEAYTVNNVSQPKEKDDIYTYSASITKALTQRFSITIGQAYIDNKSNITSYDYKRAITSLFINAQF